MKIERRFFLRCLPTSAAVVALSGARFGVAAGEVAQGAGEALGRVTRDERVFANPRLELVRLLQHASRLEHGLLLQLLYASFSVKPAYADLSGDGTMSENLLTIATERMRDLGTVNHLLAEIGAAPDLAPPARGDVSAFYPVPFELEPLGRRLAARLLLASRTPDAETPEIRRIAEVDRLPARSSERLSTRILGLLDECGATGALPTVQAKSWAARLDPLDAVGAHGEFFRGIAEAAHPAFNGRKDAWDLAPNDAAYPAYAIAAKATARSAAGRQDGSPVERLGWLANLHYWTILVLLDGYFRAPNNMVLTLARGQMLGPLRALGHALPTLGGGAPFDPPPIDLAAGRDPAAALATAKDLLHEAAAVAGSLGDRLPDDYTPQSIQEALSLIDRATTQMARQRAAAAARG